MGRRLVGDTTASRVRPAAGCVIQYSYLLLVLYDYYLLLTRGHETAVLHAIQVDGWIWVDNTNQLLPAGHQTDGHLHRLRLRTDSTYA